MTYFVIQIAIYGLPPPQSEMTAVLSFRSQKPKNLLGIQPYPRLKGILRSIKDTI